MNTKRRVIGKGKDGYKDGLGFRGRRGLVPDAITAAGEHT